MIDHCYDEPCKNNGSCVNTGNAYQCTCPAAFTGPNCEGKYWNVYIHLIDGNGAGWCLECLICYPRTPFKNDFFSSFSVKLLCSDNPCNNNGTCIDDFGNYTCVCLPGFTGDQCQGKILINLLVLINITAVYLTVIPRARMGYWRRGHEGERNNCFSKIQLVGKKYRE